MKIDIELFTSEVKRLLNNGFYSFFVQMPTVIEWVNYAQKKLIYREQVIWVKRLSIPSYNLSRSFENIFIYTKNKKKFYKTKGKYEDIKIPCIETAVVSIESIKRHFSARKSQEKGISQINHSVGKSQKIYNRLNTPSSRCPELANFTNVWSFLPAHRSQRSFSGIYYHPTEKPIAVMERLIELTTPINGIVLDPFGGSGTTAIACLNTGRKYIVIEKEPEYYEIAKRRITEYETVQQLSLELD